jgi:glucokinase
MTDNAQLVIGTDLGATTVKTGLVRPDGRIVYQNRFPTRAADGPDAVVGQILLSVREAIEHAGGASLGGLGLGSPGVVDDQGVVKAPPNMADWDEVPLRAMLREQLQRTVEVENDANAAAIAESRFGAGRAHPDFLFVIWGTGVGGGIILNRKIFRGPTGGAGEVGHVVIDYEGLLCNCGSRGCVEAYVGQRHLSRRTAERLEGFPSSRILHYAKNDPTKIEPLHLSLAAEEGDPLAQEILDEAGRLLGVAIGSVMNTMDLRVCIVGGGVSAVGESVFAAMEQSVRSHVLKPLRPGIRVIRAQFGNDAGILGAAGLVLPSAK